jgi:hypothetical protein
MVIENGPQILTAHQPHTAERVLKSQHAKHAILALRVPSTMPDEVQHVIGAAAQLALQRVERRLGEPFHLDTFCLHQVA